MKPLVLSLIFISSQALGNSLPDKISDVIKETSLRRHDRELSSADQTKLDDAFTQFVKQAEEIVDNLRKFSRQKDPATRSNLKTQFARYFQLLEEILVLRQIKYDYVPVLPEYHSWFLSEADVKELGWKHVRISREGPDPLNRFAASVFAKMDGVQLYYDLVSAMFMGFNASYLDDLKIIQLSDYVFRDLRFADSSIAHELIHVAFDMSRKGLRPFMLNAPVQVYVQSQDVINPKAKFRAYEQNLPYEEMIAFAYNIMWRAKDYSDAKPDARDRAKALLAGQIEAFIAISENTTASSHKAQGLLAEKKFKLDLYNGLRIIVISNARFSMKIYLPKEVSDDQAPQYAQQILERAVRLAQFNLDYFAKYPEFDFEKAGAIRTEQKKFIDENFKNWSLLVLTGNRVGNSFNSILR